MKKIKKKKEIMQKKVLKKKNKVKKKKRKLKKFKINFEIKKKANNPSVYKSRYLWKINELLKKNNLFENKIEINYYNFFFSNNHYFSKILQKFELREKDIFKNEFFNEVEIIENVFKKIFIDLKLKEINLWIK